MATQGRPDEFASGLLETAPVAMVGVDADGAIVLVNAHAERLFGYPRVELVGQQIEMLVPEAAHGIHAAHREGYFDDPRPRPMGAGMDLAGRRRDGTTFPVEISLSAIDTDGGRLVCAAVRHVTERKRAGARFRGLLEAAPDALVGVDADGVIVLVNAQAERLFGYLRDELVGQKIEILIPDGARDIHPARRAGYLADPRPRPMGAGMDLAARRRDGTEFAVEISLSAIEPEDGIVVTAAIRDVTERKRAEVRFRGLLEAAPDAIVGVDADGMIVLINAQAERLFGYPRVELIGQQVEMLIPDGVRDAHPARRAGYTADPRPRLMGAGMDLGGRELAGRRRDGTEFPVEISLSAFVTEDGIVVSASVRDVTERRRIEQALRDTNAELVKVGRTKDTFLASMSHELRTPLNAILGFTGTLLMELPGPLNDAQQRQLRIVEDSGKHLLSIINDLLDLAKIESSAIELALEAVDCVEIIEGVMASLQGLAAGKGLVFTAALPLRRLVVRSNTRALGQILINLVSNAIKFTDTGHVRVELHAAQNGSGPTVTVQDSGSGIAEEELDHLFNAFERGSSGAASQQEGTGLGLHISRKLAAIIGAEITVTSTLGSGTTFAVRLGDQT